MASQRGRIFRSKNVEKAGYIIFWDMKHSEEFCDVTFDIAGRAVSAHRIIVAAAIPYYLEFLSDKDGAQEESYKEKEFILPDGIDPSAFENLIEYAYSGQIEITDENVKCLLTAACILGVGEVTEACSDFVLSSLSATNAFKFRDFACDLKYAELLKDIDEYICENFGEMSEMEEFCSLPFDCVEELLKRDDLRVFSEEKVFTTVMKWVKNCPEQRKAKLPELLNKVRLTLLDPSYLWNHVASERLIHESIPCRGLLDEARNYHLIPRDRGMPSNFSLEPRCKGFYTSSSEGCATICVFSVSGTMTPVNFNQQKQTWKTEAAATFNHIVSLSAVVGAKLYYIHGNEIKEYDTSKNEYKVRASLHGCYSFCGTTSLNGKIYFCGGQEESSYFNKVECYDPDENTWEVLSDMRESRSGPGVTTLADCIYVLGGTNGTSIHRSVEKYSSLSAKWKTVPSMLSERYQFGCTTLRGRIYVCGGVTTGEFLTKTAEVYEPMSNKWMSISSIKTLRFIFKLLPYQGKLYTVGGLNANGSRMNSVEVYDPNSDKWKFGKEVNSNYVISAAEVILLP